MENPYSLHISRAVSESAEGSAIKNSFPCFFKKSRQREWNVPICMRFTLRLEPSCFFSRSFSSFAAWLVKVTAVISPGLTFLSSSKYRIREISVFVFPVPGPAATAILRAIVSAACFCFSFNCWMVSFCFSATLPSLSSTDSPESSSVFFWVNPPEIQESTAWMPGSFSLSHSLKNDICPLGFSISSGSKRLMVPYSPSNPGLFFTCPVLNLRIPSETR